MPPPGDSQIQICPSWIPVLCVTGDDVIFDLYHSDGFAWGLNSGLTHSNKKRYISLSVWWKVELPSFHLLTSLPGAQLDRRQVQLNRGFTSSECVWVHAMGLCQRFVKQ